MTLSSTSVKLNTQMVKEEIHHYSNLKKYLTHALNENSWSLGWPLLLMSQINV